MRGKYRDGQRKWKRVKKGREIVKGRDDRESCGKVSEKGGRRKMRDRMVDSGRVGRKGKLERARERAGN